MQLVAQVLHSGAAPVRRQHHRLTEVGLGPRLLGEHPHLCTVSTSVTCSSRGDAHFCFSLGLWLTRAHMCTGSDAVQKTLLQQPATKQTRQLQVSMQMRCLSHSLHSVVPLDMCHSVDTEQVLLVGGTTAF